MSVKDWLMDGMLAGDPNADEVANKIIEELGDHALTKSHARHISPKRAAEMGVKVVKLEDNQPLQEAVLSIHYTCIQTLSATDACKIIENHNGLGYVDSFALPQS